MVKVHKVTLDGENATVQFSCSSSSFQIKQGFTFQALSSAVQVKGRMKFPARRTSFWLQWLKLIDSYSPSQAQRSKFYGSRIPAPAQGFKSISPSPISPGQRFKFNCSSYSVQVLLWKFSRIIATVEVPWLGFNCSCIQQLRFNGPGYTVYDRRFKFNSLHSAANFTGPVQRLNFDTTGLTDRVQRSKSKGPGVTVQARQIKSNGSMQFRTVRI